MGWFARLRSFYRRHERHLSTAVFLGGFLFDSLSLSRADRLFDDLVLSSYLLTAFAAIVVLNARGRMTHPILRKAADGARLLLPFSFGGLFSGFLIFYSKSGVFLSSAPFLSTLALFFLGTEFLKKHFERLIFQLCVFFVALFSYSELLTPVLLSRMGGAVFILAGVVSLALFFLSLKLLRLFDRAEVERAGKPLFVLVAALFLMFTFFYFNNMIPPVPLALRGIGVYHDVERLENGSYLLSYEPAAWFELGKQSSSRFHEVSGAGAFVWSAVYAPVDLSVPVVHDWQRFNPTAKEWQSVNSISFPIHGGRLAGFRAYSFKENLAPGKWRVDVRTARGQIIGRLAFEVFAASSTPLLESAVQ